MGWSNQAAEKLVLDDHLYNPMHQLHTPDAMFDS